VEGITIGTDRVTIDGDGDRVEVRNANAEIVMRPRAPLTSIFDA
jgi:hypothetical protein